MAEALADFWSRHQSHCRKEPPRSGEGAGLVDPSLDLRESDELHHRPLPLHNSSPIDHENACRGAAESPVFCREGAGGMGMNQGNLFLNQKQIISISETNYFYFRNKLFLFQKH
jgi:hypothetical protein